MNIEKEILEIIEAGISKDNIYYLPEKQLDRKIYVKVNKILELLGGEWNRKMKGHIFETPINERIENVILTGEVIDKKQELQFFKTPENIVNQLCSLANLKNDSHVLEPSAGQGAILNGLQKYTNNLYWVELDYENASKINIGEQLGEDFLQIEPTGLPINRIVMNPPFTRQQDIEHVTHALKFIKNGILISVMSPSIKFRTNRKTTEFMDLINKYTYEIIDLPEKSFKKSGTAVNTIILKVVK